MHDMMTGMFWGGVVMAAPPVLLGLGIAVVIARVRARGRAGGGVPSAGAPGGAPRRERT
jgi:hypothetical protein